jgi:hypothetical protein
MEGTLIVEVVLKFEQGKAWNGVKRVGFISDFSPEPLHAF